MEYHTCCGRLSIRIHLWAAAFSIPLHKTIPCISIIHKFARLPLSQTLMQSLKLSVHLPPPLLSITILFNINYGQIYNLKKLFYKVNTLSWVFHFLSNSLCLEATGRLRHWDSVLSISSTLKKYITFLEAPSSSKTYFFNFERRPPICRWLSSALVNAD